MINILVLEFGTSYIRDFTVIPEKLAFLVSD